MDRLSQQLRGKPWGLTHARSVAAAIASDKAALRTLLRELFGDEVEPRKRAADVARRITERNPAALHPYADELAGLLESLPPEESRTRWHIGLVVPRVAHTPLQRIRAARIMLTLAEDQSNVVRCSAVEGLGTLALADPSLRDDADAMIAAFLRDDADAMIAAFLRGGTLAMKSRARHVHKALIKKYGEP